MRLHKLLLMCAVAAVGILAFTHGNPAGASLIQDLQVSGGFAGTGQITFNTDSGNSAAGVDAFDFTITASAGGLPVPKTFDNDDINAIEWSINPSDWSLTLFLRTNLVDGVSMNLNNTGQLQDDLCGIIGANDGSTYCTSGILVGRSNLTTTAVHDVPEPTTLALFAIALAGLGFMMRRRQKIA